MIAMASSLIRFASSALLLTVPIRSRQRPVYLCESRTIVEPERCRSVGLASRYNNVQPGPPPPPPLPESQWTRPLSIFAASPGRTAGWKELEGREVGIYIYVTRGSSTRLSRRFILFGSLDDRYNRQRVMSLNDVLVSVHFKLPPPLTKIT